METKYIYDLMLNYFVSADELHPVMNMVNNGGNGYVYASDGHIAIRIDEKKCMKKYEAVPRYPNAEKIIQEALDREGNKKGIIKTNDLIRLLCEVSWHRLKNGDNCKECDGSGEIECEHCHSKLECEECNGKGIVDGRIKEFSLLKSDDSYYLIKIGIPCYKADYIYIIVLIAQMCQIEEIHYIYKTEEVASIFSFDGVDILLMPYLSDNANVVLQITENTSSSNAHS